MTEKKVRGEGGERKGEGQRGGEIDERMECAEVAIRETAK